jgi:hypothetical protein
MCSGNDRLFRRSTIALHRITKDKHSYRKQQKLQHLPSGNMVAHLGDHRQGGNRETDQLQESSYRLHLCETNDQLGFPQAALL